MTVDMRSGLRLPIALSIIIWHPYHYFPCLFSLSSIKVMPFLPVEGLLSKDSLRFSSDTRRSATYAASSCVVLRRYEMEILEVMC